MLENYTNEHFADMQNGLDFLIEKQQEMVNLITKNLGEAMGQFAQRDLLPLIFYYLGGVKGEEYPEMSVAEIKEMVEEYRPRLHRLIQKTVPPLLKDFEENCDKYMQIFEQGIYYGQFGVAEGV